MKVLIAVVSVMLLEILHEDNVNCQSYEPADLFKSAFDLTRGVLSKGLDSVPNPDDFFQLSKNVVAGYPFVVAYRIINMVCLAALSAKTIQPRIMPDISKMAFILRTPSKNISVPFSEPEKLWLNDDFRSDWPFVMVITGWKTNFHEADNSNTALEVLWRAYKCRGNVNFVEVDTAEFVDTLYIWSAFNTQEIGRLIGLALVKLIETYPADCIHLIGHSLGAQIASAAARTVYEIKGVLVEQITGLDPANPCFRQGHSLNLLSPGDAKFVLVIHSNPGCLGNKASMGDVDAFPNGLNPLPPGCITVSEAHARSYEYFAESVIPGNENNFMGVKCTSLWELKANYCTGKKYPMGYATPKNVRGTYFLETKADSPYGMNARNGFIPVCAS